MKACHLNTIFLIVAGALLSGCADMKSGTVLDTVGPMPGQNAEGNPGSGTLIVYSANKVNADFNSPDPNRREHSDYNILSPDGKLVKNVHNVTGDIFEGPVPVDLPAGKYLVVTRSNGYGLVTIPVVIESKQNTELHLDGYDAWPDRSLFNQANTVRLPDGEVVGWKASDL